MRSFILRRLGSALVLVLVASLLAFMLINLAPGDVARLIAEQRRGPGATSEDVAAIRHELGMDQPFVTRYLSWIWSALHGDLGVSLQTSRPIVGDLAARSQQTLVLVALAAVVTLLVAVTLAVAGTILPRPADAATRFLGLLGLSTPVFYLAALLILVFGVGLRVLPTFGFAGPATWILPAIALGVAPGGLLSRVLRLSIKRAETEPYVVTGLSKGLSRTTVLRRDVTPNVVPGSLGVLAMQVGTMIPGAVVIESVFAWQGLGLYFLDAVKFRDFPVMQSFLLVVIVVVVALNAFVDIVHGTLDPRLRRTRMVTG